MNILNLVSSPINRTVLFFVSILIWSFFRTYKSREKRHCLISEISVIRTVIFSKIKFTPNILNKFGYNFLLYSNSFNFRQNKFHGTPVPEHALQKTVPCSNNLGKLYILSGLKRLSNKENGLT